MKRLLGLLLQSFAANPVGAEELCDAACLIVLEFSSTGYIEAGETLRFAFGDWPRITGARISPNLMAATH